MAETADAWIATGLGTDLDGACRGAVQNLITFLSNRFGLTTDDAYHVCSMAADLSVTQLVNGVRGVHAHIEKQMFEEFFDA